MLIRDHARRKRSSAGTRLGPGLEARFAIETGQEEDDNAREKKCCEVSTENWAEERDRLVRLLAAIESGAVMHVDEDDLRELHETNPQNVAALKKRLAQLNRRLAPNDHA